ncbi:MAG: flagellar basal body P-ring protein FlgI, partial [Plesiomonas sp.]
MRIPWLGIMMAISCVLMPTAKAARIKDVAAVEGVRNNQLVGYGLVVGLTGTGEKSPFTEQSFKAM